MYEELWSSQHIRSYWINYRSNGIGKGKRSVVILDSVDLEQFFGPIHNQGFIIQSR